MITSLLSVTLLLHSLNSTHRNSAGIKSTLILLTILWILINLKSMLLIVHLLGRSLKIKQGITLRNINNSMKKAMMLMTIFLTVFEGTMLPRDQVWIRHFILNWKQVKFLLWISLWQEDNYQVKKFKKFCKLFRLIKWLFSN